MADSMKSPLADQQPNPGTALVRIKPPPRWVPLPWAIWFWNHIRKVVVFVFGMTIIALGLAMLALPGPGWLTIFAGLGVLATEFAWARWALRYAKARGQQLLDFARGKSTSTESPPDRSP